MLAHLNLIPTEHWDYGISDTIRGLGTALLAPRLSGPKSHIEIPDLGPCVPVRSARAAIVLALKALRLRPGASVGVPLYCCPVVFSAIKTAGCRARFVDIDPKTFCLSAADLAAKSSGVDAVIAVHMFGNVCDISALREAAPNKPIIEDCAQALGSRLDGQSAGSFGEIAVFSFRSGKYLSVGEGGALYCGDPDLRRRLACFVDELPIPGRKEEVVHVMATTLRSLLRRQPLWGLVGSRLWQAHVKKADYTRQASISLEQIYNTDRSLIIERLPQLAGFIEKQRSNAACYSQNLTMGSDQDHREEAAQFFNRLQYPLVTSSPEQCSQLSQRLHENQVSTARPYKDIATIAAMRYGYMGDCPEAEQVAQTILVIPCNYALSADELRYVATCVNRAWKKVDDHRPCMKVPPVSAHPSFPEDILKVR